MEATENFGAIHQALGSVSFSFCNGLFLVEPMAEPHTLAGCGNANMKPPYAIYTIPIEALHRHDWLQVMPNTLDFIALARR